MPFGVVAVPIGNSRDHLINRWAIEMNRNQVAVLFISMAIVFAVGAILDWWNKRSAERLAERLIRQARAGELKDVNIENSRRGSILTSPDGIRFQRENRIGEIIPWTSIEEVTAFKRDLGVVDLICVAVIFRDNGEKHVLEVDEEMTGFTAFRQMLEQQLSPLDTQWFMKVASPPFATSITVLWRREHQESRSFQEVGQ